MGPTGPRAHWQSSDLVDYALSGHQYLYGHPDREPLIGPADQPAVAAGMFAFTGAMAALFARDRPHPTRESVGQTVEVSHLEAMAALHQVTLIRHTMSGTNLCRMGNRYTGQGQPNTLYKCRDGWVAIACVTSAQVHTLLAVAGLEHLLEHPRIDDVMDFMDHPEVMDVPLQAWLADQAVDDVVELFQALRIPCGPNRTMTQLLADPQLVHRKFWGSDADHPQLQFPGPPNTTTSHQPSGNRTWTPSTDDARPLSGLRVLDLTRVWAGPLATRTLADLGADVTWLEAPWSRGSATVPASLVAATRYYPDDEPGEDPWNRNAHYNKYALGKQSLALDLQTDEGQAVLTRLVPHFDVLIENYSSRVMPQLGFDEATLHALNPDLIYMTMPGFGRSGPAEHWVAYGSSADTHAGLSSLIGYPDEAPWKGGIAWPDPMAGLHATAAILTALWDREALPDRGGLTIEQSQFESTINAIGHLIVKAQMEGDPVPVGNADARVHLQATLRCSGDDAWVSVTITETTQAAVRAMLDVAFDDALAEALRPWAAVRTPTEAAEELQSIGVAAGEVHPAGGVMTDPQLRARDAFVTVQQPSVGAFEVNTTPIRLSATPASVIAPAPQLGEHNVAVLRRCGFSNEEIEDLQRAGIVTDRPSR